MLLFELREKTVRGGMSNQFVCAHCQHTTSRLVSSIEYLSFAFFSLFPVGVKRYTECACCRRKTLHKKAKAGEFPKLYLSDQFYSFFGSITLLSLALVANSYASFLDQHQAQVRFAPKVGDILFVHDHNAPTKTKWGGKLPYRMAKVVNIDPDSQTVALSYGVYTYDSDNSIYRDFIGKHYLFDSYFKRQTELVPLAQLTNSKLFYDTKRSLRDANVELVKPIYQFNEDVKQQIQQTNELARLFKFLS